MSSQHAKVQRLSLVEGFPGDFADSECNTPQDFLYETKFVVLNYLGLVPPNLDPGYSEFDINYASSSATPFSISDDDRSSASGGSRRSTGSGDFLKINTKLRGRRSPKISPRSDVSSSHPSPAILDNGNGRVLGLGSSDMTSEVIPQGDPSQMEIARSSLQSEDSDLVTDCAMEDFVEGSNQPSSDSSEDGPPEIRIDDGRNSWELHQRREVIEPLREEVQQAMAKLQEELKEAIASGDLNMPVRPSEVCSITREALVAQRIAQIGDKIMQQRGDELERSMMEILGGKSHSNLSYVVFRSVVKEMMKSTVPGWYHLALVLRFTKHMAFGLIDSGGQGFSSITDFAVRYIEENLAQTIIDQGGWDAMTNVNLDELNPEILSELSSRNVSPMPLSSQSSYTGQSQETESSQTGQSQESTDSLDAGTPVDSPNLKKDADTTNFPYALSDDGLNQLTIAHPDHVTAAGELTHRSRAESRPEDLAALFVDSSPGDEHQLSHSVSSPSNLGGDPLSGRPAGNLPLNRSAPTLASQDGGTQGSTGGDVSMSSLEESGTVDGNEVFEEGDSSHGGNRRLSDGKVMAAVAGTAAAIFRNVQK